MGGPRFRAKPSIIEAVQFTGTNYDECFDFMNTSIAQNEVSRNFRDSIIRIHTLEGTMIVSKDDFIIKGTAGEFYPCKPVIFKNRYDAIV